MILWILREWFFMMTLTSNITSSITNKKRYINSMLHLERPTKLPIERWDGGGGLIGLNQSMPSYRKCKEEKADSISSRTIWPGGTF